VRLKTELADAKGADASRSTATAVVAKANFPSERMVRMNETFL